MARCSRESLLNDEIIQELRADRLSDAPSDCESDKSSNDYDDDEFGPSTSQKGRKRARLEVSDSDINIDDDNDVGDGWTKNDDLKNLKQYLGNTGLTFKPDDPTDNFEVVNRLLGNDFLEILLEKSNLYHVLYM
jgi:hypothetical protein